MKFSSVLAKEIFPTLGFTFFLWIIAVFNMNLDIEEDYQTFEKRLLVFFYCVLLYEDRPCSFFYG